jgi:hypothetical protein
MNALEPLWRAGPGGVERHRHSGDRQHGWFFVRAIAMVFDRYLQTDRTRAKFSKII